MLRDWSDRVPEPRSRGGRIADIIIGFIVLAGAISLAGGALVWLAGLFL